MSDKSQYAQYILAYHTLVLTEWMVTSATALFAFEYFITLGDEITEIWLRKWSGATWLYIANRYVSVFYVIMDIIPTPTESVSDSCNVVNRTIQTLSLVQFFIFAAFSSLRVYALWGRNITLGMTVFSLALVPMIVNIYNDTTYVLLFESGILPFPVCGNTFGLSPGLVLKCILTLVTRLSAILADVVVLTATLLKTWSTYRESLRAGLNVPIASLLIRDGASYFAALLLMNIYQIIGNTSSTLLVGDSGTIYISVLTPILISRFLLNLRKVNRDTDGELSSTSSRFSAMQFGNPVGTVSAYGDMSGLAWDDFPEAQNADLGNNDIALVSISSIHTRSRA